MVKTLLQQEHKLNQSVLCACQHYQFMKTITETTYRTITVNSDVLDHAVKKCEEEIRAQFGVETLQVIHGKEDELTLPDELAKEIEEYMELFIVIKIPFCKKLLDASRDKLNMMVAQVDKGDVTIIIEEEFPQMKIVGKEKGANEISEQFKIKIRELEKELDVGIEHVSFPEYKLELFLLHGVDDILKDEFHVAVKIEPPKRTITIEGPKEQISLAVKEAYKRCTQIVENNIDLNEAERHFLESGGIDVLNNGMKKEGLKGMMYFNELKRSKAKILLFEDATTKDVQSYLSRNMFVKKHSLDEDSLTLLKSNKWKEFCETSRAENSVIIYTAARSSSEIALVGEKLKVEKIFEALKDFMKRNTIVKQSVELDEGCLGYLIKHRTEDLNEIKKKLGEHSVRMRLMEHEGRVHIDGTKTGVEEARKYVDDIISTIAKGKICFDKLRTQEYLESEPGRLSMEAIENKNKCSIHLIKDDGGRSMTIASSRPKELSKLLCSYETRQKISLKVFNDDIVKHSCDVIVNAANGDLKHVGGVAKSILDAGGEEIQDECDEYIKAEGPLYEGEHFSGKSGNLPCKRLIHAVGPRWDDSKPEKICKTLRVTCKRVLEEAMDFRSIALPAIGSGIFGIPKEICADIMIEAAEEFGIKNPNCALKDIRFVNIDDKTSGVFLKKFREKFRGRSAFTDNQVLTYSGRKFGSSITRSRSKDTKREEPEVTSDMSPKRMPGDFIITKRNMKISLVVGDLSTYKVNTRSINCVKFP